MTFHVIDNNTGKEVTEETLRELTDKHRLDYIDLEGFAITEEGRIILCDECGRFGYVNDYMNPDRFKIVIDDIE